MKVDRPLRTSFRRRVMQIISYPLGSLGDMTTVVPSLQATGDEKWRTFASRPKAQFCVKIHTNTLIP